MGSENLHVSSFVLVKNNTKDSIALLRAGPSYPVAFKRARLLLPARILTFGENPRHAAESLVSEQINGVENKSAEFVTMQSYLGAHWDIVFLFETVVGPVSSLKPKAPFTELEFFKLSDLPSKAIAEDHLEVLNELSKELQERGLTTSGR